MLAARGLERDEVEGGEQREQRRHGREQRGPWSALRGAERAHEQREVDLEKHGERVSGNGTPTTTRQNTKNTLRHTGTTKLNSQNGKPSVSVPANLNSNCKRERSP